MMDEWDSKLQVPDGTDDADDGRYDDADEGDAMQ